MRESQFIHIDTFSRKVPLSAKVNKISAREMFAEANREEGSCPHVAEPQPPILIYGIPLKDVEKAATKIALKTFDAKGRRLRIDSPIILAGVVTAPWTRELLERDAQKAEEWRKMRELSLGFLRKEYGDNLVSVVEHVDEAFPHIHFYVMPKNENNQTAKFLHCGYSAGFGLKGKAQRQVYCAAMRAFQDRFFADVGSAVGLARIGPARQRLTRDQWLAQKQALAALEQEARRQRECGRAMEELRVKLLSINDKIKEINQILTEKGNRLAKEIDAVEVEKKNIIEMKDLTHRSLMSAIEGRDSVEKAKTSADTMIQALEEDCLFMNGLAQKAIVASENNSELCNLAQMFKVHVDRRMLGAKETYNRISVLLDSDKLPPAIGHDGHSNASGAGPAGDLEPPRELDPQTSAVEPTRVTILTRNNEGPPNQPMGFGHQSGGIPLTSAKAPLALPAMERLFGRQSTSGGFHFSRSLLPDPDILMDESTSEPSTALGSVQIGTRLRQAEHQAANAAVHRASERGVDATAAGEGALARPSSSSICENGVISRTVDDAGTPTEQRLVAAC
jgi:hypothetical protein